MNTTLTDYKDNDTLFSKLVSIYALNGVGWGLSLIAAISIAGIICVPFLIAAQILGSRHAKGKMKAGEAETRRSFEKAGFRVTRELQADGGRFLIDESNEAFAYWKHGALSFTPGIATFDEVTEVGFRKEGDEFRNDPLVRGVTHHIRGKTSFAIKFNRFDQPVFAFGIRSPDRAEVLMQQFAILAKLS